MHNGTNHQQSDLIEFTRIGLIHSPSGRLLTSETFQGSLNVSGVSLKRKQIWTLFVEARNPTAFLLQNHLGNYLSADHNGKVTLVSQQPGPEERFVIHFNPRPSGEIALQSEKHGYYLQWSGTEMRCFSKEPVWWGMRLGIHPQIHLLSVHRSCFIRSAKKESELRAVTKMPCTSKFLLWLEQPPLPPVAGPGAGAGASAGSCSKVEVARLSRVALRSQSGRYLRGDGSLVDSLEAATLFALSFKPGRSLVVMFQDEEGQYLTAGAAGILKVKPGAREPRREESFSIQVPTNQVRLWAFNNKFACNKHGLTFSATMEETEEHKSTVYELEYVGGRGLDLTAVVNTAVTPSVEASSVAFTFDGVEGGAAYLTTGLWRLRSEDRRLWMIPPTGPADLAPKDSTKHTTFEILYLPSYVEEDREGGHKGRVNLLGGVVLRTPEGLSVGAKPLGAIGSSDRRTDAADWQPTPPEVLHLLPLVNRTSVACYSPLVCAYLAPTFVSCPVRRSSLAAGSDVDCTTCIPQQWQLRHLVAGTVQFFTKQGNRWMILSVMGQGMVTLTPSDSGPDKAEAKPNPDTEFVICMINDRYALVRGVSGGGPRKPAFLAVNPQGILKMDASGTITPGCIWLI